MIKFIAQFHPRRFLKVLSELDETAARERDARGMELRRPVIVLVTTAVCLLLINYLKYHSVFYSLLSELSDIFYGNEAFLVAEFNRFVFSELTLYIWWGGWHLIGYVLIPVLVIKYILKEHIRDYGIGFKGLREHWVWYVYLAAPIVVFAYLASFREDFLNSYPFYNQAARSFFDFMAWELIYLVQFVCLEFFFRGFVLRGCYRSYGAGAIFIMCVPYLMIHFTKPWLEATGAILFGMFLGVLALRSRSIWGGVAVHITIALSMDLFALARGAGFPANFWPG